MQEKVSYLFFVTRYKMTDYTKKQYEEMINSAAEIILHANNGRCPVKCTKYMDKVIDPCVAGDICLSSCPDSILQCWINYIYCEEYHYRDFNDNEEENGDEIK